MEKGKWLTRDDIDGIYITGVSYDMQQAKMLLAIAHLLIDIRTLLGQEGNNGKAKNWRGY